MALDLSFPLLFCSTSRFVGKKIAKFEFLTCIRFKMSCMLSFRVFHYLLCLFLVGCVVVRSVKTSKVYV